MLLPQRKTYKGKLQLQGGSIMTPSKATRKFSIIRIGRQELHNIEVSQYFEQLLVEGEEIELTLTCASLVSFIFAMVGCILYLTGEILDFSELIITGPIVLVVSLPYWFYSFINSGHGVYSIKINNRLYRNNAGVQYEASVPPAVNFPDDTQGEVSVLPATNLSTGVKHEVSVPPITNSPEKNDALSTSVERPDTGEGEHSAKSDLSNGFNSRILRVSKLSCPQCASEALVVHNTNIICGNCMVWMQVDKS